MPRYALRNRPNHFEPIPWTMSNHLYICPRYVWIFHANHRCLPLSPIRPFLLVGHEYRTLSANQELTLVSLSIKLQPWSFLILALSLTQSLVLSLTLTPFSNPGLPLSYPFSDHKHTDFRQYLLSPYTSIPLFIYSVIYARYRKLRFHGHHFQHLWDLHLWATNMGILGPATEATKMTHRQSW